MKPGAFHLFKTLLQKDLLLSGRRSTATVSILFFTLLLVIVFQFSFDLEGRSPIPAIGGFIWLGSLFGGMLRLSRTFETDTQGGALDGLRQVRGIVFPLYWSKLVLNFLFMVVLEFLLFVAVIGLFNVPYPLSYLQVSWSSFVLGALGFAAVGTTFSGMALGESSKDLLLPIIAYPILSPLILGVVKSFQYASSGILIAVNPAWTGLLIAFDLIYVVLSLLVFEVLLENH